MVDSAPTRQKLNLAAELLRKGELRQAEAIYQSMAHEFPEHAQTLYRLGVVKRELGERDAALLWMDKAARLNPSDLAIQGGLALLCKEMGQPAAAADHFLQVVALGHDSADVRCLLGDCFMDLGKADEAIVQFRAALTLEPALEEGWINLVLCLKGKGWMEEALACCQQGLAQHPESIPLHINHALALLTVGQFRQGWLEYRWRLRLETTAGFLQQVAGDTRLWEGESLEDATLLVVSDQGFGDAIHGVRYLTELKALGAQVFFHCPSAMAPLMREAPGVDRVVSGQEVADFPFDFYVPLLSLPELLGTHGRNIPGRVPYLHAASHRVEQWQPLFADHGLRVGLAWQGQPLHPNDPFRRRSIPPQLMLPLLAVPGVTFYGLQPTNTAVPPLPGIMDLGPFLSDFAETAAMMAHLDLIISIDTAAAHLAGALAKPVWTLLPMAPDWRWGLRGDTTPWYPTMRLFRPRQPGHWQEVIHDVVTELTSLAASRQSLP